MVAPYPVAYRAGAFAVGVAAGGMRGLPGGLPGFAAGAAVTAAWMAWQLSKGHDYNPPMLDPTRIGVDALSSVERGTKYNYHGWGPPLKGCTGGYEWYGYVWLLNHNPPSSETCKYRQLTAGTNPDTIDWAAQTPYARDLHTLRKRWRLGRWEFYTWHLYHKDAGDVVDYKPQPEPYFPAIPIEAVPMAKHGENVFPEDERGHELPPPAIPGAGARPVPSTGVRAQQNVTYTTRGGELVDAAFFPGDAPRTAYFPGLEIKAHITMFGLPVGTQFLLDFFEILDLVDALYQALDPKVAFPPQNLRRGEGSSWRRHKSWRNERGQATTVDKVDVIRRASPEDFDFDVVASVLEDNLTDFVYGIQGQAVADLNRMARLPVGLQRSLREAMEGGSGYSINVPEGN